MCGQGGTLRAKDCDGSECQWVTVKWKKDGECQRQQQYPLISEYLKFIIFEIIKLFKNQEVFPQNIWGKRHIAIIEV